VAPDPHIGTEFDGRYLIERKLGRAEWPTCIWPKIKSSAAESRSSY